MYDQAEMTAMTDDLTQLTFEQALEELDSLISRLEGGQIDLEAAVTAYSRGAELAAHCSSLLDKTEATITQLVAGGAGTTEVPLRGADAPARARAVAADKRQVVAPVDPDDVPF